MNNPQNRRSIAASLIRGVYVPESDPRLARHGTEALAPRWWEFFNFRLIQTLIDDQDQSYFGSVYEFNFPNPNNNSVGQLGPPRYVIAFRGTINKQGNRAQDFKLDLHCIFNSLEGTRRYQIGFETVQDIVSRTGPENVWVAGHSLGSSIALLIGRHMAKDMEIRLDTYLFNPPFASPPIQWIKYEPVKLVWRFTRSAAIAGLALVTNGGKTKENDSFVLLSSWIPNLFINLSDPICSGYVGYFEHREKMESIGAGNIEKVATKFAIGNIVRGKDYEPPHFIPSTDLSANCSPAPNLKEAHGIHQWWKSDLDLKCKRYKYQ